MTSVPDDNPTTAQLCMDVLTLLVDISLRLDEAELPSDAFSASMWMAACRTFDETIHPMALALATIGGVGPDSFGGGGGAGEDPAPEEPPVRVGGKPHRVSPAGQGGMAADGGPMPADVVAGLDRVANLLTAVPPVDLVADWGPEVRARALAWSDAAASAVVRGKTPPERPPFLL